MNIKNFLEKLRSLPDTQKKIIVFAAVAVLGLILGGLWFNSAAQKIKDISQSNLPFLNLPSLQIPSENK